MTNARKTCGQMPEWSNGAVSKTVVPVMVPRVRIPVCPPFDIKKIGKMLQKQELTEGILQEKNSLKLISDNPVVPVRI